jgi:PAS domain S-box-containing protein
MPQTSDRTIRKFPSRIELKLLLLTLAALVFFAVSMFLFEQVVAHLKEVKALEEQRVVIEQTMLNSIEEDLWLVDKKGLQLRLQSLTLLPNVAFAEIVTAEGETDYSVGVPPATENKVFEFPLFHEHRGTKLPLGTLRIIVTLESVRTFFLHQGLWRVFAYIAVFFIVSLWVLLIAHKLIVRHLWDMSFYVRNMSMSNLDQPLRLDKKAPLPGQEDEIDTVSSAINNMRVQIAKEFAERDRAEAELRAVNRKFESLILASPIGIFTLDTEGKVSLWNPALEKMFGWTEQEVLNRPLPYVPLERSGEHKGILETVLGGGQLTGEELRRMRKDGSPIDISLSIAPLRDDEGNVRGLLALLMDVTERTLAKEELQAYAEAQRVLLREVNHRVKNNLMAIMALLHVEERKIAKAGLSGNVVQTTQTLQDMAARISSLYTVHSLLSANDWKPIELKELCEKVLIEVFESSSPVNPTINVSAPSLFIDSSQSHYLALVMSELATNTAKHAVAEHGLTADVTIEESEDMIGLTYRDNGPGFPDIIFTGSGTDEGVGLELLKGIVRQSLRGTVDFSNKAGAVTLITFPKKEKEQNDGAA